MSEPGRQESADRAQDRERAIARMQRLAWLLDSSIAVPLTSFRIGIDSLIGLIPGVGDAAGAVLSAVVLLQARKLGVPWLTQLRMLGNVLLELALGSVPILGDLFDMGFKANQRNAALALAAVNRQRPARPRDRLQRVADALVPFLAIAVVVLAVLGLALLAWSLAGR